MSENSNVESLFTDLTNMNEFIVFIVEQKFAINSGYDYLSSYNTSIGYLNNERKTDSFLKNHILKYMFKILEPISELVQSVFIDKKTDIPTIINNLYKLFTVNELQVAGPKIVDPIIIYETAINKQKLSQIVSLYKNSTHRPRIILVLKDNNFDRAKNLLSQCPHKTGIKFIRNDGSSHLDYVLNTGAENINDFISLFSRQCFNACSNTPTGLIYNKEWSENSMIKEWAPSILKIRTQLLYGEKHSAIQDINHIVNNLNDNRKQSNLISDSFMGISKLFRVFSTDFGGHDIKDTLELSKKMNNEVFSAHVYRYASYMNNLTHQEEIEMLESAERVFSKNLMEDHSIYCQNNLLVKSFYTDTYSIQRFNNLLTRAINNVPGLVGMPILFTNIGTAHIYEGEYEKAKEYFEKGLSYFPQKDHRLGLMSNSLISSHLAGEQINYEDIDKIINYALLHLYNEGTAFLSANHITNALIIADKNKLDMQHIYKQKNVLNLMNNALKPNSLGRNSLIHQLYYLDSVSKEKLSFTVPVDNFKANSIRKRFIDTQKGLNPAIYNALL